MNAQEIATPVKKVQHRLGLHAGTTSGLGLSYKAVVKEKYQIQLTTLPFASKNNKMIFSGLNLGYTFLNNKIFDFLVILSASNIYTQNTTEGYTYTNYDYYGGGGYSTVTVPTTTTYDNQINSSIGIGFELGPSDVFKFNFQVGYGIYDMLTANWQTLPSIGVGFDFKLSKNK